VTIEDEAARRLFALPARIEKEQTSDINQAEPLRAIINERQETIQRSISQRNVLFFEAEADKLDGWADDLKIGLEREIKDLDRQIKEARRAAVAALSLEEKLAGQKQVKALESQRHARRRALFDAQDEIDRRRGQLIEEIEGKLQQRTTLEQLFTIRWRLVG
jgi:adenine-specific DNA-methyltransferase